jgi:hypothetical protein
MTIALEIRAGTFCMQPASLGDLCGASEEGQTMGPRITLSQLTCIGVAAAFALEVGQLLCPQVDSVLAFAALIAIEAIASVELGLRVHKALMPLFRTRHSTSE